MGVKKKIAVFASGTGSNAENLAASFADSPVAEVALLVCDREEAPVLDKMKRFGVPSVVVPRHVWRGNPREVVALLREYRIDFIVLAGFLSIVGREIIGAFDRRIVNLHPSLLPKFGGRGMWGMNVHRAVIAAGEKQSGITVHYVSDAVDGGEIVAQFSCKVLPDDTPETLAERVHALEYAHLPAVVLSLLDKTENI